MLVDMSASVPPHSLRQLHVDFRGYIDKLQCSSAVNSTGPELAPEPPPLPTRPKNVPPSVFCLLNVATESDFVRCRRQCFPELCTTASIAHSQK